jgi:hypothetical protein
MQPKGNDNITSNDLMVFWLESVTMPSLENLQTTTPVFELHSFIIICFVLFVIALVNKFLLVLEYSASGVDYA